MSSYSHYIPFWGLKLLASFSIFGINYKSCNDGEGGNDRSVETTMVHEEDGRRQVEGGVLTAV